MHISTFFVRKKPTHYMLTAINHGAIEVMMVMMNWRTPRKIDEPFVARSCVCTIPKQ
jgi:hypothetical protein